MKEIDGQHAKHVERGYSRELRKCVLISRI
jgi:hypothetical protein